MAIVVHYWQRGNKQKKGILHIISQKICFIIGNKTTTGNKQQTGILKIDRKIVNYAQHKETMGKVCEFFFLIKISNIAFAQKNENRRKAQFC